MSTELKLWIKKIIVLLLFAALLYGIYHTIDIVIMILTAGFITLLISPLVDKWKRYKIPEWLTVSIVYIIVVSLIVLIIGLIAPIIINYMSDLSHQVLAWSNTAQETYSRYGIHGFNLPRWLENSILYFFSEENIGNTIELVKQNLGTVQTFFTNQIGNITTGGLSLVTSIGMGITNFVFVGIATFFMVLERKAIGQIFLDIAPDDKEEYIVYMFLRVRDVSIAWIKASLMLSFSIFILTFIGLHIAQLIGGFDTKNVFTLSLISGVMEFIPYLGPILSIVPALIIALGISWKATIIIVILYVIIQQAENNILVPIIMSKNLDISPLFVFLIMLFGASLGGIMGIIVAVPIAGIIKVFYMDYIDRKKKRGRHAPVGEHCDVEYEENSLPDALIKGKKFLEKTRKYIAKMKKSSK